VTKLNLKIDQTAQAKSMKPESMRNAQNRKPDWQLPKIRMLRNQRDRQ
jgi:hypothetical protein